MMSKPRVVYVHGIGTTHWSYGWAPWLKAQLEQAGFGTFFETMPDSIMARAEYWLPFLEEHVKVGEDDILVGWSSGGTAALRYAESHKIGGSVLIAPSCTDLDDESERVSGYFNEPWKWSEIAANQRRVELLTGTDDPYIPQAEFETIAKGTGAHWKQIRDGGHFMEQSAFPEALQAIVRVAESA